MLPITVFIAYIASHAVVSAATVPLPEKIYYDLEDAKNLFEEHVKLHERNYDDEEYIKRFEFFKKTLIHINYLNAKYPRTVFKVTHFADLTKEEKQSYLGFKAPSYEKKNKEEQSYPHVELNITAPDSFDWRDHGVVTPVKNQGHCGSCYIFSAIECDQCLASGPLHSKQGLESSGVCGVFVVTYTQALKRINSTANIEGQYAIKHQQLVSLSEQQCLDCLPNLTCGGGIMVDVMQKLSQISGSVKEQDYPYTGVPGECKENANVVAKVTGGEVLNIANAEDMKQKLHDIGPLSVALDASDFFSYHGGVLHPERCSSEKIDHAVTLVGYGEEHGEKYWILKNSWGMQGEQGYVRLLRGVNACNIEKSGFTATAHVA